MKWISQLFSRHRLYADLSSEIQEHLEEKVEALMAQGVAREEAMAMARREFGNAVLMEEHGHEVWQWPRLETFLRDLRLSIRQLRRNPGYTFIVLLTLTLAIGVNTVVFTLLNALLIRPLPFTQPDRLGELSRHYESTSKNGHSLLEDEAGADGEMWELVRHGVPAVEAAARGGDGKGVNLQTPTSIRYVRAIRVSAAYFHVLGIQPYIGRAFTDEEDMPGGPKVAVISYGLWKSAFSSDPEIAGKTIRLKGEPYIVTGVLPEGAHTISPADVWTPLRPSPEGEGQGLNYRVMLRLRDGATWEQARSQLARLRPEIINRAEKNSPAVKAWLTALPLQQVLGRQARLPVMVLMFAVACILLIACANLAGLLMVRVGRRTAELATRLALGASRAVVLRQLLLEPLLLSLAGGGIGLLLAFAGLRELKDALPAEMLPVGGVAMDGRVAGFAVAASLLTAVLIAVLPALELRLIEINAALRAGKPANAGGKQRTRQALIAGEVMLTLVLLAGAGLLIRTLVHLQTLPPGFDSSNVISAQLSLDDARYHKAEAFHSLLQQAVAAMKGIPGVESAAFGLSLPYESALNIGFEITDGAEAGSNNVSSAVYVTPEYFRVLRVPLLAGRDFADSDTADSEGVAIVDATFARKFFHDGNATGHHLRSNGKTFRVIGVVGDITAVPGLARVAPLANEQTFYIPATQVPQPLANMCHVWFQPSWIVRTRGPVSGLENAMRKALAGVDPALPLIAFRRLSDIEAEALQQQRMEVMLLGSLAGLALLLAIVGIYGLVSNTIVQRTREIGIRMALGATLSQAMVEVGRSGLAAVGFGLVGGAALCAATLRIIKSQLYGVRAYDPLTLAAVAVLFVAIAAIASFAPTLRIARINPASTLRAE